MSVNDGTLVGVCSHGIVEPIDYRSAGICFQLEDHVLLSCYFDNSVVVSDVIVVEINNLTAVGKVGCFKQRLHKVVSPHTVGVVFLQREGYTVGDAAVGKDRTHFLETLKFSIPFLVGTVCLLKLGIGFLVGDCPSGICIASTA